MSAPIRLLSTWIDADGIVLGVLVGQSQTVRVIRLTDLEALETARDLLKALVVQRGGRAT